MDHDKLMEENISDPSNVRSRAYLLKVTSKNKSPTEDEKTGKQPVYTFFDLEKQPIKVTKSQPTEAQTIPNPNPQPISIYASFNPESSTRQEDLQMESDDSINGRWAELNGQTIHPKSDLNKMYIESPT